MESNQVKVISARLENRLQLTKGDNLIKETGHITLETRTLRLIN